MRMWNRWNLVSLEVHEDGVIQNHLERDAHFHVDVRRALS